ncbi:MAG: hypothetical protein ABW321_15280 [Polyangiales bacterium]
MNLHPKLLSSLFVGLLACGSDSAQNTGESAAAGGGAGTASPSTPAAGGAGASAPVAGRPAAGSGGMSSPAVSGGAGVSSAAGSPGVGGAVAAAGGGGSGAGAAGAAGSAGAAVSGAAGSAGAAAPGAGAPAAGACDRACLLGFMQGYIDALLANDASKLVVSPTLRYTENGEESKLGETVWQTAMTLVPEARLDFADPQEGQVASQFVFEEGASSPVIYQVRLKVADQQITEIETMAVRRQGAANGFFNVANMTPQPVFLEAVDPAKRATREELSAITDLYLDYLEGSKDAGEVPFDEGCKRYENGQVTASGLSSFNAQSWGFDVTRRVLVIDEEAGITWGMFPFFQTAETLVVGEAFKIFDGKIMMIQAVMANQPARTWDE